MHSIRHIDVVIAAAVSPNIAKTQPSRGTSEGLTRKVSAESASRSSASRFAYDIFVVRAAADEPFVHGYLLAKLGLLPERVLRLQTLELGQVIIEEIERGVRSSRVTIALDAGVDADAVAVPIDLVGGLEAGEHLRAGGLGCGGFPKVSGPSVYDAASPAPIR